MKEILELVDRAAASSAPELVLGESGTGKELVARRIHGASPRAGRPFVAVNCKALAESVLESQLFGHEKGAFRLAVIPVRLSPLRERAEDVLPLARSASGSEAGVLRGAGWKARLGSRLHGTGATSRPDRRGSAMTAPTGKHCVACQRGSDATPLLTLEFRGGTFHICAQHLPVLIHDPGQLAGRLAGAESLSPAEHRD